MRYDPRSTPPSVDPTIRKGFRSFTDIVLRWDVRLSVATCIWVGVMLVALTHCGGSPTAPKEAYVNGPCSYAADFCANRSVVALDTATVRQWQEAANVYIDEHYSPAPHVYPSVSWRACYFVTPHGACAAGFTESRSVIHVSTAEPQRTAALVAHETEHARYWTQFGDPDADHRRAYGW